MDKERARSNATKTELKVLMMVYSADYPLNLPEIVERVRQKDKIKRAPQTISTMLARLVSKGYLTMQRVGRTYIYRPVYPLEELQELAIKEFLDNWFYGDSHKLLQAIMQLH